MTVFASGERSRTFDYQAGDVGYIPFAMVYASGKAQQDQAESILRAHRARGLTYFGRWSITDVNP